MAIERLQGQPQAGRQRPLAAQPGAGPGQSSHGAVDEEAEVHAGEDVQAPDQPVQPGLPDLEPLHGLGLRHRAAVNERVPQVDQAPLRGVVQAGQQVVLDDGSQLGDDQRRAGREADDRRAEQLLPLTQGRPLDLLAEAGGQRFGEELGAEALAKLAQLDDGREPGKNLDRVAQPVQPHDRVQL
jgi:hypothetical protein